jgi:hypothetical protein
MIEMVKTKHRYLKFEIANPNKVKDNKPRLEPSVFVNWKIVDQEIDKTKSIEGFSSLQQLVFDISGIVLNEALFLREARLLRSWQFFFKDVLSVTRPKTVFLVCYYHLIAMSLIRECKEKGITSVDIQHGARGSYQAYYTHWTKIPNNGYELIPDFFWCWGQISKNNIERTCTSNCVSHQAIVGGNLRLAKFLNGNCISKNINPYCEKLKKADKLILIAMSDPSIFLPKFVLKAMRASSVAWRWLIRLHPYHCNSEEKDRLSTIIQEYGIYNYEIDFPNDSHLYELLRICDHHITFSSSTCYEALKFGVPTTFIDPSSFHAFGEDINNNIFMFADTSEALIASIKQEDYLDPGIDMSEYIETDKAVALKSWNIILNHSQNHKRQSMSTINILSEKKDDFQYSEEFISLLPESFAIETILGCDLKCPECAIGGNFITRKKGWMQFKQFKITADKIRPFCKHLYLHIWGEPLLNKDIFQMIEYASTFTSTNISTNGKSMTEEKAERLTPDM